MGLLKIFKKIAKANPLSGANAVRQAAKNPLSGVGAVVQAAKHNPLSGAAVAKKALEFAEKNPVSGVALATEAVRLAAKNPLSGVGVAAGAMTGGGAPLDPIRPGTLDPRQIVPINRVQPMANSPYETQRLAENRSNLKPLPYIPPQMPPQSFTGEAMGQRAQTISSAAARRMAMSKQLGPPQSGDPRLRSGLLGGRREI